MRSAPAAGAVLLALACLFGPGAAARAADCPTAADLGRGIVLSGDGAAKLQLQRQGRQLITVESGLPGDGSDGQGLSILWLNPLAQGFAVRDGKQYAYRYGGALTPLEDATTLARVEVPTELFADNVSAGVGSTLWQARGKGRIGFGGCRYDVIYVSETLTLPGRAPQRNDWILAPALGTVVGRFALGADGTPAPKDPYRQIELAKNH